MKKSIFLFFAAILCAVNADARKIYLDTKKNWDQASAIFFVHSWGGDSEIQGKMERIGNTSIFQYEIGNNTDVLFTRQQPSDNTINMTSHWNKTGDINVGNKNYVRITDWGKGECGTWTVAGGDDTQILEKKWDTGETKNDMYIKEDGIFYLEKKNKQLTTHTLGYKVVYNHAWDESYGKNGNNAELKISEKYNYNITFTFNPSTQAVAATATKVEHYLTGNANLVGGEGWKANEVKMTYNTSTNNGTYTHTFSNLAAHTIYEMKVTDGTWDNNWDYDDLKEVPQNVSTFSDSKNIAFYLSEAGNVTVTFDAKTGKIELTGNFAKIVPTINLLGLGDNWEVTPDNNKMESKSEDIVSCTANLGVGVHGFKIYVTEFDKWYGNSAAIIRDNASVNKILTDGGSNVTIHTDVEGEYEFIWNYETKELSVVYPTATVEYDKIYFVNANNWSKVYAYLWLEGSDPTIKNAEWHGIDITANKEGTVNGYDIHYVTFIKGAYDKCIFNGGGDDKKTDNLAIMDDYKYFYQVTGSWYANLEDIEASTNKFILGKFNNWAKEHGEFLKVDENIYSITIPITAGTYEFKVVDDAWLGNGGTMKRGDTSVKTGGWTFKSDDNSECKLVADIDGDYTFTWYSDTKKLTVQYPPLTLTTGNNSAVIDANIDKTVDVVIERSFTADAGYYTLCLPFDIAASEIGTAYKLGAITKHVSGEEGGININLTSVSTIEAGVPYLVLPKTLTNPVFENVTIKNIDLAKKAIVVYGAGVKITFTGIINGVGQQTNATTEYYIGDGGFLYNGIVEKLGLCSFFTITDEAGNPTKVRARVVNSENAATGVDNITNTDNTTIKVIENGQLIIIRNGEKFNAQGVRL